jgi:H+/Cl- antiporter ClcA
LAVLLLPPLALPLAVWLTRAVAPEAGGSGIPQVIAASQTVRRGGRGDARVSLKTAALKMVVAAVLLLCGLSIGREGPTVQIVAALVFAFTARLRGGPHPRTLLIAGGAAGVAAAFNTPIAGVVFAVEELAKGFDRRANTVVILVVVASGAAAYALAGNYAYFGQMQGSRALLSAWMAAPILGVVCGLAGGGFSRALAAVIGPRPGPVGRWRAARPVAFALICGLATSALAFASHGLSYGTGYAEASSLLEGHPVRGLTLALSKWAANLAAAASGAPGGIFSPSLATGAGIGAALSKVIPFVAGRDTVVLGMAGYLSGVVQAPLTSAIILMEMTRDPGLVGPLMLTCLIARWVSGRIMKEPIYHLLARTWMRP